MFSFALLETNILKSFSKDIGFYAGGYGIIATVRWEISLIKYSRPAPREPAPLQEPAPLFVTSLGRSGSTALMSSLAASREVLASTRYPNEDRTMTYFIKLMRLAMTPATNVLNGGAFLDDPNLAWTNPFISNEDFPDTFAFYKANAIAFVSPVLKMILSNILSECGLEEDRARNVRFLAEKIVQIASLLLYLRRYGRHPRKSYW